MEEVGTEIRKRIGALVREKRTGRGWSLRDVSRETGGVVPKYAVDRIESGEVHDITPIALVLNALDFELPDFLKIESAETGVAA